MGCVIWTREKEIIINPNMTSTLVNPLNSRYRHVLTVTGRFPGAYACGVLNNKPTSSDSGTRVNSKFFSLPLQK